ncbi:hypothetical protein [Actinoallomurus iriomotensis]|uniref:Uncharacterized protein n=1 Tax=Actinoallomurus iriomotensis TaxID=478107 RepID=A0A9W6VZX6_9ACTN|nr:hypothetical protein [Actinoallomurus iriomotensis]GLY85177.1 hypothetical protein Airi02_031060 [Actinoallomurus iriomotensis]
MAEPRYGEEGAKPPVTAALDPVAGSLLRKARRDAARIRTEAHAAADALLAQARAEAGRILAEASATGRSEAAASARAERIRARRRARTIVLAARREAYEELRRRVRSVVASLCADSPVTVDRLRRLACDRAGGGARTVTVPGGGVIAVAADRRVDCSASALADHAVDVLGAEVERLWES